jgi:hypothetical protein
MGCAGFSAEIFSCALSWRDKPEGALKVEGIRKGGIGHEVSLLQFLIASNKLSRRATSGPAEFPLLILTHTVGLFFKGGPRIGSAASPLPVR